MLSYQDIQRRVANDRERIFLSDIRRVSNIRIFRKTAFIAKGERP